MSPRPKRSLPTCKPQQSSNSRFHRRSLAVLLTLAVSSLCFAAQPTALTPVLSGLTFDELSQITVTSVSKRPQSLSDSAAAVRVITDEDIEHSGSTRLPEALRNVAGLNVAQINGSTWAIGARNYQWQYDSKLLVMMDGRSVYTPVFGGVFWDMQDYLMEDIDRVEVVMGPGGTIWGANAFNGVINVISKSARDTLGGISFVGTGNEQLAYAGARYGWCLGKSSYARLYTKLAVKDDGQLPDGRAADDSTRLAQSGFRIDGNTAGKAKWSLQGDAYVGWNEFQLQRPDLNAPAYSRMIDTGIHISGGNLLGKWENDLSPYSTLRIQSYLDYARRDGPTVNFATRTADLDVHYTTMPNDFHQLDFGFGYRYITDRTGEAHATYAPNHFNANLYNVFAQDEIKLSPDSLSLIVGTKAERNDYTGTELQPNVRLLWHPAPHHTLWAAWSTAIRTPTRVEAHSTIDPKILPAGAFVPGLPTVFRVFGSTDLKAEKIKAWEFGWRSHIGAKLSLDLTSFYYNYAWLIIPSSGTPYVQASPGPAMIFPTPYANGLSGEAYGAEATLVYQPLSSWRLRLSYGVSHLQLHPYIGDPYDYEKDEGNTPRNTASLQSYLHLNKQWSLDTTLRYVDTTPFYKIESYFDADARLAWRPSPTLELSLVGQNLLHSTLHEYSPAVRGRPSELQRSVYAKIAWKF